VVLPLLGATAHPDCPSTQRRSSGTSKVCDNLGFDEPEDESEFTLCAGRLQCQVSASRKPALLLCGLQRASTPSPEPTRAAAPPSPGVFRRHRGGPHGGPSDRGVSNSGRHLALSPTAATVATDGFFARRTSCSCIAVSAVGTMPDGRAAACFGGFLPSSAPAANARNLFAGLAALR
jgi:hypothetical protein